MGDMKLQEWLEANNIRGYEFAAKLGSPPATVSHWLTGRTVPSIEMVAKVEALTEGEVDMYDFLDMPRPVFHKKKRNGKK